MMVMMMINVLIIIMKLMMKMALIITKPDKSYFEKSLCLAHTALSLTCTSLVFWGFDTSTTAVKWEEAVCFLLCYF